MALREILLIIILIPLTAASILVPRVGVFGYLWFALMRPDILSFAEGRPYSMILAVATLIGTARHVVTHFHELFLNPISRMLLIMVGFTALSVVFAVDVGLALEPFPSYMKILIMALLIPIVCTSVSDVKMLIIVSAMSLGFIGSKFGYFGFLHGGMRFATAYGGFIRDNNSFSLAMAMTVPLCLGARLIVKTFWMKALLIAMLCGCLGAVVWSHSRTGFLSLAVGLGMMLLRSKGKMLMLLFAPVAIGGAIFLAGDAYLNRMSTITNYEQESSAYSRIVYTKAAIRMWRDHPLFGVGFGGQNWVALSPKYLGVEDPHVVHNTYAQILVDSGIGTLLAFLALLFGTLIRLEKSLRGVRRIQPELEVIPKTLQAALLSFAVGCTFLSLVKFDILYFLLMICASWWTVYRNLLQSAASGSATSAQPAPPRRIEVTRPNEHEVAGSR
jgi:putative inorganic carbon (hco3(-)) transporter